MRITVIGARSARFALQLVGDIVQAQDLSDDQTETCLMDVEEERLNATFILAKKYAICS